MKTVRTNIRERLSELGVAIVGGFPEPLVSVAKGKLMIIVIRGDKLTLGEEKKFTHTILFAKPTEKPLEELYRVTG